MIERLQTENITKIIRFSFQIPHNDIWIPDLTVYTLKEEMKINYTPWGKVEAVVYKDGSVVFIPPVTMKTWCKPNYDNWPFGEQVKT